MSGAFSPPSSSGSVNWASPGTIGSTAPNTGSFTTLTQSGPLVCTPSATQTLTTASSISANARILMISSASPITLTSNPQISVGTNGQEVILVNVGSNAITLSSGNGLLLPQSTVVLYGGKQISFTYMSVYSSWVYKGIILESLALTGSPTAPTAGAGTSTTQIATTAFVEGAVNPVWSAFTFQNSFTDTAGYQTCRFTKIRGLVYLQGVVSRSATGFTSGMVIATLPVGLRPASKIKFPGDTYYTPGSTVDIDTSGNILLYYNGTPTSVGVNLCGIVFPV
jgi:hypothetical protein